MRAALWPDAAAVDLRTELEEHLKGRRDIVAFVLEMDASLVGFLEASIRPWAEGCTTSNVGYVEGWYVEPAYRGQGFGAQLVRAAEEWAIRSGSREMGSDAFVENVDGRAAHQALGYEERTVNVHFRKLLT